MAEKKIINTELQPIDKLLDSSGDAGTSGQILSSTGSGTNWITSSSGTITGSGSQNYIPLWSSGTVLTDSIISSSGGDVTINGSDNDPRIYINPLGGDIGDTAMIQFNSRGHVGYTSGLIELGDNGQSKDIRLRVDTADIIFQTSNTTRMTITTAGNVGIGTQSPSEKLSINGGNIAVANGSSIMIGGSIADTKIGKLYNVSGVLSLDGDGTRNIRLGSTTNGEVVRIDNTNGRVGVGTDSPSAKLHISGSDSTASAIRQSRTGISRIWDQAIDSSGRLQWGYRATESGTRTVTFSLDDNNFVGIGAGAASPSYPLYVYNADAPSDIVAKFHTGDNSTYIQLTSAGSSWQIGATADSLDWYNDNNTAVRMSLLETGNLGIATTAPNEKLEVSGNIRVSGSYKVGATEVISSGRRFFAADGTDGAPAYSFSARTDTGMFVDDHGSNDRIFFSVDGTARAYIDANGISSNATIYVSSAGSFRNYSGVWKATTGTTGNGFQFFNTADNSSAVLLSITSVASAATDSVATFSGKVKSAQTASGDDNTVLTTKSYVDGLVTGVTRYMGLWDASSGTGGNPDLTASTYKVPGYYFIVSVAGDAEPNGAGTEPDTWHVGDWVIWSDQATDAWQKIDNTSVLSGAGTANKVAMWNGDESLTNAPITISGNDSTFTGGVTAVADSYGTGQSETIYTAQRTGGAVAGDWSYDDATTDMSLGTSTSHSFSLKTGNTRALTIDNSQNSTFKGEIKLQLSSTVQRALSSTGTESMQIGDAGTQMLRFKNAAGVALDIAATGTATFSNHIDLSDNKYLMWGGNAIMHHTGTYTYIGDNSSSSVISITSGVSKFAGNIQLDDNSGASPNIQFINEDNDSWYIYNDSNGKFQVQQASTIRATFSSGDLEVRTPLKVSAGAVSISGDGANYATLTESGSGDLTISAVDDIRLDSGGQDIVLRGSSSQEFGRLTNNSGNFNITGADIAIDASGDITLDAAGSDINLKADGTNFGRFTRNSDDFHITSTRQDGDIKFYGDDGGSSITALRLDMSDAGWAHFNTGIAVGNASATSTFAGNISIPVDKKLYFGGGSHTYIGEDIDDRLRFFVGGAEFLRFTEDTADTIFICQNAKPLSDSAIDLGSTTLRYANIWVDNINGGTPTTGGPYLPLAGGTMTGDLQLQDNVRIDIGNSSDLQLWHNGTNSYVFNYNTGALNIGNSVTDGNTNFLGDDGSGGEETYFRVDGGDENVQFSHDILLYDNINLKIGTDGDFQAYHNGSITYLRNNTGTLEIRNQTSGASDIYFKTTTSAPSLDTFIILDGSAEQTQFTKDTEHQDSVYAKFGTSGDLTIVHTGSTGYIQNYTGDLQIQSNGTDADILLRSDDGSGGLATYMYLDGGNTRVQFNKDARFVDDKKVMLGTSDDLQIYHSSVGTGSFIIESGPGDLEIYSDTEVHLKSGAMGENYAKFTKDGPIELYYDNSKKFETTTSGIDVHGSVTLDDYIYHSGDTNTFFKFNSGGWEIQSSGGPTTDISATGGVTSIYGKGVVAISCGTSQISTFAGDISPGANKVLDRNIPCLFNSNFLDGTSSSIYVVPFNNNTETTVSAKTYYHYITIPYAGKVTKVTMKNVSGSPSSSFTTQLFLYVNGSQVASSAELTIASSKIEWSPTASNTFAAGDELTFGYQKSASSKTWSGVSFGVAIELTNYDI